MNNFANEAEILESIQSQIASHKIMVFMKGNPTFPRCGFSATVADIFDRMGVEFGAMDILPDPRIRQVLSLHSSWPTIPQVFIDGEFVGGCDIVREMDASGDLRRKVEAALANT